MSERRPQPEPALPSRRTREYPGAPVVLVDDEPGVLESYELTLLSEGFDNIVKLSAGREVASWVAAHPLSALVLDLSMPEVSGLEILKQLAQEAPEVGVVVCTAHDNLSLAVDCMRLGAQDYLVKPVEPSRFVAAVRSVVERWQLRWENERLRSSLLEGRLRHAAAFERIVTRNERMQAVFRYVEAVAPTGRPILITGETGVGKELIAQAIHEVSGRAGEFVAVNIAEFDDALLSDTLFGHVRGAFTGAERDRPGLIERARGGTLFLDEIGDLQPASQAKLLRLLQEQEYLPVGADRPRRTDARIVLATLRELEQLVREGRFRRDLFYRISAHRVAILPLRERRDDLQPLVEHFVAQASAESGRPPPRIPPALMELLAGYAFPGNVRELQGLVFDAVATQRRGSLAVERVRALLRHGGAGAAGPSGPAVPAPTSAAERMPTLAQAEQELIDQAIARAQGNQTQAAKLLGISRTALIRRLRKRAGPPHPRR